MSGMIKLLEVVHVKMTGRCGSPFWEKQYKTLLSEENEQVRRRQAANFQQASLW